MNQKGCVTVTTVDSKLIFAENLRYYMRLFAVSQKELAEILNVKASTVSEWANARKYPRIDKIEAIARYFHVEKSDLIENKYKDDDPLLAEISRLAAPLSAEKKQAVIAILRSYSER